MIVFDPLVKKRHHRSFVRPCMRGLDFAEAARTSDAQTGASVLDAKLHAGPVIVLPKLET